MQGMWRHPKVCINNQQRNIYNRTLYTQPLPTNFSPSLLMAPVYIFDFKLFFFLFFNSASQRWHINLGIVFHLLQIRKMYGLHFQLDKTLARCRAKVSFCDLNRDINNQGVTLNILPPQSSLCVFVSFITYSQLFLNYCKRCVCLISVIRYSLPIISSRFNDRLKFDSSKYIIQILSQMNQLLVLLRLISL